jgi:hypothetical protein
MLHTVFNGDVFIQFIASELLNSYLFCVSSSIVLRTNRITTSAHIKSFPCAGTSKDPNKSHKAKTKPPETLIAIAPLNPSPSELLFFADLLINRAIPIPKKTPPRILA